MAYRKQRVRELRGGVERALAELELSVDTPAHDGWLDPGELARALAGDGPLLLRAGAELTAGEDGFGAVPSAPLWLRVDGGPELRASGGEQVRARGVRLSLETLPCCDQPKCDDDKTLARLCIETDGRALCVAEAFGGEALGALGAALAARLEVELTGGAGDTEPAPAGEPLPAAALARWALRREGEVFVLRDLASRGPREAAPLELGAAAVMFAGGVAALVVAAMARHGSYQEMTIAGAIGVVLVLAGWATLHIGLHSARYRGGSEALLYTGGDRLVVAPWHSRSGAVDIKPEGRYGAALKLSEVDGLEVVTEPEGFTLRAQSSHGAYDIGTLETRAQAELWQRALTALTARVAHVALVALVALVGCSPTAPVVEPTPMPGSSVEPGVAAPLRIIEDDVPGALALARETNKVVFVEVWAPWCHTCLSMKSFVLPNPALAPLGERVVFAAIDGDLPKNADFMAQHTVNVWPTLFVLDGRDGAVLGIWLGSASVGELRSFITDAVDARDAKLEPGGPLAAMLAAKRAQAKGDFAAAGKHYQAAVDAGGEGWPRRSEALTGLVFSLYKQQAWDRCAEVGVAHVDEIEGAAVPADFAGQLLSCATKVANPELKERARTAAKARLKRQTDAPPADTSVDDRSDALSIYADALKEDGDAEGATQARRRQVALLEEAAAKAPGPKEASTFDYARMVAYLALGEGDKAVVLFRQRATEQPDNYEPFARLGQTLLELGRLEEAREPIARAVELSYGPRQLGYLSRQALLYKKLGEIENERTALRALIDAVAKLAPAQRAEPRTEELRAAAQKRLDELANPLETRH